MIEYIHIGSKIADLLEDQHMTKRDLGLDIGMSPSNAVYLTTRESIDVRTLHKVGVALKYNFFKHFPIDEQEEAQAATIGGPFKKKDEKDRTIDDQKVKIAGQEKIIDDMKRDLEMLRQENGYLKEINALLKGKQ